MKKQLLFSFVLVLTLMGCKKETEEETPEKTVPVAEEPVPAVATNECYSYKANGTDINMQIETKGNEVSGALNYFLAEKDSNVGTFIGKSENGILILEYTFESEGVQSTRQVAFKSEDGKLIEGYGEMNEDGTKFKDVSQLKFDSKMPLTKTSCAK